MSGPVPKLEARSISKVFSKRGGSLQVLDGIDLRVEAGEFVALLGASGCGKTTLLRILNGLEQPTDGEVLLDGKPQGRPGSERGFVFQADTLFPWRTIQRNVALGLELQGQDRAQARERARVAMETVGLKGFEDHYPHELSGGMRQRANLARALSIEPEVLLMDEPFAALDAQTRDLMQAELLRIWRANESRTVLFVTHQLDEAVFLADRIVVLTRRPGRIREEISVPFTRPRDLSLKRTPEFLEIVDHLWNLLEEEVREAMLE